MNKINSTYLLDKTVPEYYNDYNNNLLKVHFIKIDMFELKINFGRYVDLVGMEDVIISKYGKPVADYPLR